MLVIRETTDWKTPNHTYVLEHGRLIAYKNKLDGQLKMFSSSIHFDRSNRTFEQVSGVELEDLVLSVG